MTIAVGDTTQVDFFNKMVMIKPTKGLDSGIRGRSFRVIVAAGVIVDSSKNTYLGIGTVADSSNHYEFTLADTRAPLATALIPKHKAMGVSRNITLKLTFNEPVYSRSGFVTIKPQHVGATQTLSIADPSKVAFSVDRLEVTIVIPSLLVSNVQEQLYSVILPNGALVDGGGVAFPGFNEGDWAFFVEDRAAPLLKSIRPRNATKGVAVNTHFILTFNEPIAVAKGNITFVPIGLGAETVAPLVVPVPGDEVYISGNYLRVDPIKDLNPGSGGQSYTLLIAPGVITDDSPAANPFAGFAGDDFTFSVEDKYQPVVAGFVPGRGEVDVTTTDRIAITFNEHVSRGYGHIVLKGSETGTVSILASDASQVTFSAYTMYVAPTAGLLPGPTGQQYYIEMVGGFGVDRNQNPISPLLGDDYYFTMKDTVAPVLQRSLSAPRGGAVDVALTSNITLVFTEPVSMPSTLTLTMQVAGLAPVVRVFSQRDVVIKGSTVTLVLPFCNSTASCGAKSTNLPLTQATTLVGIELSAGAFVDPSGNTFAGAGPGVYSFSMADVSAPLLNSASPTSGARNTASDHVITLKFGKQMSPGYGNIVLLAENGAEIIISVTDTTQVFVNGTVVTIAPTNGVDGGPVGQFYDVVMLPGVLVDTATSPNAFAGFVKGAYRFHVRDTAAPKITSITPADSVHGAPLASKVVITFSERVVVGNASFHPTLTPSATGAVIDIDLAAAGNTFEFTTTPPFQLTITPPKGFSSALATQQYELKLPAGCINDVNGNTLPTTTYTFTVVDVTGPSLTSTVPANYSSMVLKTIIIRLAFNQKVQPVNGTVSIVSLTNPSSRWDIDIRDPQISFLGDEMTVDPYPNLLASNDMAEEYTMYMSTGAIADTAVVPIRLMCPTRSSPSQL